MAETEEVEVVAEGDAPTRKVLSASEARKLTDRINTAAAALTPLVTKAFEGQAWKALGHETWKAYVIAEFKMSYENAWKHVLQGQAQATLTEVAGAPVELSTRAFQTIGKRGMPDFMAKVRDAAAAAPEAEKADVVMRVVTDEVETLRARKVPSGAPRVQVKEGQPRVMIPTWIQGVWPAVQKVAADEGVDPTDWVVSLISAQALIQSFVAEAPAEKPKRGARARQSAGAPQEGDRDTLDASVPEGVAEVEAVESDPDPGSHPFG